MYWKEILTPTLYFLRSSEQKIAQDMTKIAHESDASELEIYYKFYGLTPSDLGLYSLIEHNISGAAWIRNINDKAILSVGVKPEFRNKGIATAMLNQLFLEAGTIYDTLHVELKKDTKEIEFFKKLGFILQENSTTMIKNIENKEVIRPTDGYDPTRWIE